MADTLDAMTSDRPYRRGSSFTEALAEIRSASGSQFDPAVVAALGAILEELRQWREQQQPLAVREDTDGEFAWSLPQGVPAGLLASSE